MEENLLTQQEFGIFGELGRFIVNSVISIAELLTKSESSPGIVALIFILFLTFISVLYYFHTRKQLNAI
ncbi:hypothetical protein KHP62_14130 [Rhodobacteraceae bacterium NNCM2]|nr:hypothetical protein [Coraliihabitans acroporae]